ncbi:hypothetical protein BT69DRAFT_1081692 [Atractiella rhizophila]|nr:hypothetical protein BT69DRAFT_1081692 [Atractiella rhizophila]
MHLLTKHIICLSPRGRLDNFVSDVRWLGTSGVTGVDRTVAWWGFQVGDQMRGRTSSLEYYFSLRNECKMDGNKALCAVAV